MRQWTQSLILSLGLILAFDDSALAESSGVVETATTSTGGYVISLSRPDYDALMAHKVQVAILGPTLERCIHTGYRYQSALATCRVSRITAPDTTSGAWPIVVAVTAGVVAGTVAGLAIGLSL